MICRTCKEDKPETPEYYHRHKGYKNGLHSECKVCAWVKISAWKKEHPEDHSKECKKWRLNNPEKIRAHFLANRYPHRVVILSECLCDVQKKYLHHPDYSKPYETIKLCPMCHKKEHRRLRLLSASAVNIVSPSMPVERRLSCDRETIVASSARSLDCSTSPQKLRSDDQMITSRESA